MLSVNGEDTQTVYKLNSLAAMVSAHIYSHNWEKVELLWVRRQYMTSLSQKATGLHPYERQR